MRGIQIVAFLAPDFIPGLTLATVSNWVNQDTSARSLSLSLLIFFCQINKLKKKKL